MKLREFLLKKTKVGELVQITDCGWNCAAAIIDHEDLSEDEQEYHNLNEVSRG